MALVTKSIELPNQVELPYVEQGDSSGVPVLMLHGFAGSWRNIEDSRLLVYPGAGHELHYEEPERFASDLMAFIKYNIRLESSVA